MATIWLGDFRLKQLQQYLTTNSEETIETDLSSIYLIDEYANYFWLDSTITQQLQQL